MSRQSGLTSNGFEMVGQYRDAVAATRKAWERVKAEQDHDDGTLRSRYESAKDAEDRAGVALLAYLSETTKVEDD